MARLAGDSLLCTRVRHGSPSTGSLLTQLLCASSAQRPEAPRAGAWPPRARCGRPCAAACCRSLPGSPRRATRLAPSAPAASRGSPPRSARPLHVPCRHLHARRVVVSRGPVQRKVTLLRARERRLLDGWRGHRHRGGATRGTAHDRGGRAGSHGDGACGSAPERAGPGRSTVCAARSPTDGLAWKSLGEGRRGGALAPETKTIRSMGTRTKLITLRSAQNAVCVWDRAAGELHDHCGRAGHCDRCSSRCSSSSRSRGTAAH
jgi:hypothetical protein